MALGANTSEANTSAQALAAKARSAIGIRHTAGGQPVGAAPRGRRAGGLP
jgi:hypothetical protein